MKSVYRLSSIAATLMLCLASTGASAQTVTLWTFLDPAKTTGRDVALKNIIEQFEAANPGIKIRVESQVFSELGAKFLLGHRSGTAPDVTFVNMENIGALLKADSVTDLQAAFISKWPAGAEDDFYMRAAWDAAKIGDARYAVPLFAGTSTLFYRKDLLAEAGIDPSSIKSWDQLTEAARQLTRDTNGDGAPDVWGIMEPLSPERTGGVSAILPMIAESQDVVWDSTACTAMYDTEAGQRAIQTHANWINVDKVMSGEALVANSDDVMEQFAAGRFAMAVGPFARFSATAAAATWDGKANLAIMPWPTWDGATTGPQTVTGWYVAAWKNSPNLEAATKFIEYMISEDGVREWSTTGGQVPTRNSILADAAFADEKYEYMREMQSAWSNRSLVAPTNCNMARFDADLNSAVQRVVLGEASASDALKEAEQKFRERQ